MNDNHDQQIPKLQRIGILTNTYPPIRNGVSMAVVGLEKELTKFGIEVFVATPKVEGVNYANNVFTFEAVALPKDVSADLKLAPVYNAKIRKYFASKDVQLIHTCDTLFGGIEGAFVARELDIPCVHTFHTLIEDYQMVSFPAYNAILRKGIKEICNSYDHIIAPSHKVYKYLLSLTTSPISQIYNVPYLSPEIESKTIFSNFADLRIEENDFVFITFCRLSKEKGLDLGIKTLAPILKHDTKIKYVIAGDGPELESLKQLADNLGVLNQVIFCGKYSPDQLQDLIVNSRAKVFLFTSLTENLPTNILEAMYFGLPVVAVDDESVDYLVKHEYNGYKDKLPNLFDHCIKLVYSEGILNQLSINASASAREFLEQDIIGQHLKLYNKVLSDYYTDYTDRPKTIIDLEFVFKNAVNQAKKIAQKLTNLRT